MKTTIIVNGVSRTVDTQTLSFDDVVTLAYPSYSGESHLFKVTYDRGIKPRHGEVLNSEKVNIRTGMVFGVTIAGRPVK